MTKDTASDRDGVVIVIVIVGVRIGNVTQLGPVASVELPEIHQIGTVVSPATDVGHLIDDECRTEVALLASIPAHRFPLRTFGAIGVETVEVHLVGTRCR